MTSKDLQITFDAIDPGALAEFWAQVLGYVVQPPPEPFGSWSEALAAWGVPAHLHNSRSAIVEATGNGPRLFFQRVAEGKTAKNRVHLDVRAAPGLEGEARMRSLETECDRLCALGARRLYRVEPDGAMEAGFITMADPEGNEFCLD